MNESLRKNLINHAMCQNKQLSMIETLIDTQNFDHAKEIINGMILINNRLVNELTT